MYMNKAIFMAILRRTWVVSKKVSQVFRDKWHYHTIIANPVQEQPINASDSVRNFYTGPTSRNLTVSCVLAYADNCTAMIYTTIAEVNLLQ